MARASNARTLYDLPGEYGLPRPDDALPQILRKEEQKGPKCPS